jgi:septation ring formation regulator EzrA
MFTSKYIFERSKLEIRRFEKNIIENDSQTQNITIHLEAQLCRYSEGLGSFPDNLTHFHCIEL